MDLPTRDHTATSPPLPQLTGAALLPEEVMARAAFRLALLGAGQVIVSAALVPLLLFGFGNTPAWELRTVAATVTGFWGCAAALLQLVAAGRGARRWRNRFGRASVLLAPAGWIIAFMAFAVAWLSTGAFLIP